MRRVSSRRKTHSETSTHRQQHQSERRTDNGRACSQLPRVWHREKVWSGVWWAAHTRTAGARTRTRSLRCCTMCSCCSPKPHRAGLPHRARRRQQRKHTPHATGQRARQRPSPPPHGARAHMPAPRHGRFARASAKPRGRTCSARRRRTGGMFTWSRPTGRLCPTPPCASAAARRRGSSCLRSSRARTGSTRWRECCTRRSGWAPR